MSYTIRDLTPSDNPALWNHYTTLAPHDSYLRFHHWVETKDIDNYIKNIHTAGRIFGVFYNETILAGVGHLTQSQNPTGSDFSLSVCSNHRHKGVGRQLMEKAIEYAKADQKTYLKLSLLSKNYKMEKLALRYGAALSEENVWHAKQAIIIL